MDSDEDEQIGIKKPIKKTRGRKKSTTTAATATKTKANKKSTKSKRIIKNQIFDSSSEEEPTIETKKLKLDDTATATIDTNEFIKSNSDLIGELSATTSLGSQLFTAPSLNRIPLHENEPLNWSHKVNLIGEKSLEQRVHLCDICKEPILNYGRLLPCKHVFCYDCAIELQEKSSGCLRCNERIVRCERDPLNSVHMCNHDKQCRRTYLSQRDLLAHIQHRHTKKEKSNSSSEKSLKLRTFNNIKDDYQPSASFVPKSSNNGHHHYPQASLQTFRWVRNIQREESRKPK